MDSCPTKVARFCAACAFLVAYALLAWPGKSQAAFISVVPSNAAVAVGEQFTVDYFISGMTAAPGDSLSGFDVDVQFDATLFGFGGGSFFDAGGLMNQLDLADPSSFGFIGAVAESGGGVVDAYGISGNSAAVLDSLQLTSFRFLSLSFTALANGTGNFALDLLDPSLLFLDSGFGDLPITFSNSLVTVAVGETPTNVPEPGTAMLMLAALAAAGVARRRPSGRSTADRS